MSLATSLATAQNLLHGKNVAKTAFQRFAAGTLAELCDVYGMSVKGTSRKKKGAKTKSDYIAAIFNFVSHQIVCCLSKPYLPNYCRENRQQPRLLHSLRMI
jgi:5'(3')-deoxyribonucleotidase